MSNDRARTWENVQLTREKRKRIVKRTINCHRASTAVGPLRPGCEIFGLTKGQFSLVELIEHCLLEVGPSEVMISTWTAGGADLMHFGALIEEELITKAFWLLDSSFPERQPQYCKMLVDRFGTAAVTCTGNHAKFVLIKSSAWRLVIITSMNLNKIRRGETWSVSDDPGMFDYLLEFGRDAFIHGASVEATMQNSDRAYRSIANIMGKLTLPDKTVYTAPRTARGQIKFHTPPGKVRF